MGEGGNCLMSHQSYIRAALEVIEAQFRLFVLKTAFHAPPRESHLEQHAQGRFARRMDDEELELLRFQDVAGHDQVSPFLRQAIHAARIYRTRPGMRCLPVCEFLRHCDWRSGWPLKFSRAHREVEHGLVAD